MKNFSPCVDWFFLYKEPNGQYVELRLAGWATFVSAGTNREEVIGMVSIEGGGANHGMPGHCRLTTVPQAEGRYLHATQLQEQRSQVAWT